MKYIESPTDFQKERKSVEGLQKFDANLNRVPCIFLAGGITDCPDWQQKIRGLLADTDLILFNPRRKDFPIEDPNAAREQIEWEYRHLRIADEILFWFPCETLCPIVLFELGAWSMRLDRDRKRIHVGVHPDYPRRRDVEIQMKLVRPEVEIVYSLADLAERVRQGCLLQKTDRYREKFLKDGLSWVT